MTTCRGCEVYELHPDYVDTELFLLWNSFQMNYFIYLFKPFSLVYTTYNSSVEPSYMKSLNATEHEMFRFVRISQLLHTYQA